MLWREAIASSRSHWVVSTLVISLVAIMVTTVLFTTGRTVAAQQRVLASIDSAGTRSIVVKADKEAGLTSEVVDRIARIGGVATVAAFSSAEDVSNSRTFGKKVPIRDVWSPDLLGMGLPNGQHEGLGVVQAWGSTEALSQLGMIDNVGSVSSQSGFEATVMGSISTPAYLASMEPLLLVPSTQVGSVGTIVVVAERAAALGAITASVQTVLGASDPSKILVNSNQSLASLRGLIDEQLSVFAVSLTVAIFLFTSVLIAVLLTAVVAMQRKDYGRRRALGASRRLVILLILVQTASLATAGAVIAVIVANIIFAAQRIPVPGITFSLGVVILAVAIPTAAALLPGFAASRRDPVVELRVP